nr:M23 family metallopeptidase [Xaviernesmea oryzae]
MLLILARGDRVRHLRLAPWTTGLAVAFCALFCLTFLAATAYLVLRDDLIGGAMARQARMQQDYEDRIAALRAQVDRVSSRQLIDQQLVEKKVETLLRQQMAISARGGRIGSLIERAEQSGLDTASGDRTGGEAAPAMLQEAPLDAHEEDSVPAFALRPMPGQRAEAAGLRAIEAQLGMGGATDAAKPTASPPAPDSRAAPLRALALAATPEESLPDRADRLFSKVTLSLKQIERDQAARIDALTADAQQTAEAIRAITARIGVPLNLSGAAARSDESAVGGPFVEPEAPEGFDRALVALDDALSHLESVRAEARRLPFANPAPQSDITSPFGNRPDPFLGRLALHSGIDFRLSVGSVVHAAAPGRVVSAGYNGSYGFMIEIDHGHGVSTRYAHLSEIGVRSGETVEAGAALGSSGNTGRSTGPHLHYEVRIDGRPVDPMRFLTAGRMLASYIE